MNKITVLFLFLTITVNAQNFDKALELAAKDMAVKLNTKSGIDVAVYPFFNNKKQKTELSNLVTEDFANYLNNYNANFKLIDRAYMEQLMEEHKLNEEGLIDPATAKQFGMIIAADAYITGKVHLFSTNIRLNLVAINTQTGERIASVYKKIPLDYDIAEFVGIDLKQREEQASLYKSSNPDCEEQQVGDMCFINKQRQNLNVKITEINKRYLDRTTRYLSVAPGEKKCFYNLSTKNFYHYTATKDIISIGEPIPKGEFQVKTCKSDYIILR